MYGGQFENFYVYNLLGLKGLSPSEKHRRRAPHLCTRIWVRAMIGLLIKAIVSSPIRLKGNSKRISGNSLSPGRAENRDIGAASKTLLTGVRLRLRSRLSVYKRYYVGSRVQSVNYACQDHVPLLLLAPRARPPSWCRWGTLPPSTPTVTPGFVETVSSNNGMIRMARAWNKERNLQSLTGFKPSILL